MLVYWFIGSEGISNEVGLDGSTTCLNRTGQGWVSVDSRFVQTPGKCGRSEEWEGRRGRVVREGLSVAGIPKILVKLNWGRTASCCFCAHWDGGGVYKRLFSKEVRPG